MDIIEKNVKHLQAYTIARNKFKAMIHKWKGEFKGNICAQLKGPKNQEQRGASPTGRNG